MQGLSEVGIAGGWGPWAPVAMDDRGRALTEPLSGPFVLPDHPHKAACLDDSPAPNATVFGAAVATPWIQNETNKGQM